MLVAAYDAGLTEEQRDLRPADATAARRGPVRPGVAERPGHHRRRLPDGRVPARRRDRRRWPRATGIGDLIVAPIIGDAGPLGAIEVYRPRAPTPSTTSTPPSSAASPTRPRSRSPTPASSRSSSGRRRPSPRAPRPSGRCATSPPGSPPLRDPDEILARVVEESRRLLGSDGAHLTRMCEDGTYLVPVIVAGGDGRRHRGLAARACSSRSAAGSTASPPRRASRSGPTTTRPTRGSRTRPTTTRRPSGWACAAWPPRRCGRPAARSSGRSRSRTRDAARDRRRRARPAPGPRRPGRDRPHQLEPATSARRVRGALPPPRPELAGPRLVDRRRRPVHVRLRHVRAADRLAARRSSSASTSGRSSTSPRARSPRSTGPPALGDAHGRTASCAAGSTSSTATATRSRPSSSRSPPATRTAGFAGANGPSAT